MDSVYQDWCLVFQKRLNKQIFENKDGGLYCLSCKESYGLKSNNKLGIFINTPAKPQRMRSLEEHINTTKHRIAYARFVKLCMEKEKIESVNHSLNSIGISHIASDNMESVPVQQINYTSGINNLSCKSENSDSMSEDETLIDLLTPIIKDKLEIVYWMIDANVSKCRFVDLQHLINIVGHNKSLSAFHHNSNKVLCYL
jgi:hypothetical protein